MVPAPAIHDPKRSRSLLIVDDDRDIDLLLREILEEEGYEPEIVSNGREAIRLLKSGSTPTVILLDLVMPIMNGWEFAKAVRSDPSLAAIPLVIFSGDSNAGQKATELGAQAVLSKPFHLTELLRMLERFCGASRAHPT